MTKLAAHDVVGNCKTAFDVAEQLGIPRVIEPCDMNLLAVPDKLAVMTYLHQLRAHFTGHQLHIEQYGQTSDESSYVIGNYKSDNMPEKLLNLKELKLQLQHQNSAEDEVEKVNGLKNGEKSPTTKKDVKNFLLSGSKNLIGKVLSPTKDKNFAYPHQQQQAVEAGKEKPILLMTRRELTDPFGSDEEEEAGDPLNSGKNSSHVSSQIDGGDGANKELDARNQQIALDAATTNVRGIGIRNCGVSLN